MEAIEKINNLAPILEVNHLGKKFGEYEVLKKDKNYANNIAMKYFYLMNQLVL